MSINIMAVCAAALVAAILALTLKETAPQLALALTVAAGVIIFIAALSAVPPIASRLRALVSDTGISAEFGGILFKSLGICFLCQFASDACRDAGQSALASKVELAGKLMIVVLALPMIEALTQTVRTVIGQ